MQIVGFFPIVSTNIAFIFFCETFLNELDCELFVLVHVQVVPEIYNYIYTEKYLDMLTEYKQGVSKKGLYGSIEELFDIF